MPYVLRSAPNGSFSVQNKQTGHYFSKHTSKAKAEAQLRLLHALENKKK